MIIFCSHCGQKLEVNEPCAVSMLACPACQGAVAVPKTVARLANSPPALSGKGSNEHQLQRTNLLIVGGVVAVLFLLAWLLLQPSNSKVLQQARSVVFGRHLTAATEDLNCSSVTPNATSVLSNQPPHLPDVSGAVGNHQLPKPMASDSNLSLASQRESPPPRTRDTSTNFLPPSVSAPASALPTNIIPPTSQRTETNMAFLSSDFHQRLQQAGAKTGDVQISLLWNNYNDLDLHCVDPRGEQIYFEKRRSASGGELDVDMNAGTERSINPVENIYWPEGGAPVGIYKVYVNHFANHGGRNPTPYSVRILVKGQTLQFNGAISSGDRMHLVHQFSLDATP